MVGMKGSIMVRKPKTDVIKAIETATGDTLLSVDEQIKQLQDELNYLSDAVINLKKVVLSLAFHDDEMIVEADETKSGKATIYSFFKDDESDDRFASYTLPIKSNK